jgi:subtilisin-like proprotein convertase family protein
MNNGPQAVSLAGFLLRSDPSQEFNLGTIVGSIGAGQTLEFQSDSSSADNPGAGVYRLTSNALYRNSDPSDYARLVRPNQTLSQLNCQGSTPTPSPTPPPGSNQCANLDTPLAIPDNDNVTGVSLFGQFQDSRVITDLDVCININHTWVGDLVVTIEHADTGTIVTLLNVNPGCSNNDVRVLLDDEASTQADAVCGGSSPAINGSYRPTQSLSAFDGEMLDGQWIITVFDFAAGDTGTVLGAVLYYTVAN